MAYDISLGTPYNISETEAAVDVTLSNFNIQGDGNTTNDGDTVEIVLGIGWGDTANPISALNQKNDFIIYQLYVHNNFNSNGDQPPGYNGEANFVFTAILPKKSPQQESPPNTINVQSYSNVTVYQSGTPTFINTTPSNIVSFTYLEAFNCTLRILGVDIDQVSQAGVNDGELTINISGLQGTVTYEISSIFGTVSQASNIFSNLAPAEYTITVTDAAGANCIATTTAVIDQPAISPRDIVQPILIQVREACEAGAIYLCWLNTKGGFSYWLFDNKSDTFEYQVQTRAKDSYFKNVVQLDESIGRNKITERRAVESIRVGAEGLTEDEIKGIEVVLYSPTVLLLVSDPSERPPKWIEVTVKDGTYTRVKNNTAIEFEFELPQRFVQTN